MPEYIRALIYVCLSVGVGTLLIKTFATSNAVQVGTLYRRVGVWLMLTSAAFLGQDIWLFYAAAIVVLLVSIKKEPEPLALFVFILFALPSLNATVSGFGLVNHLFTLTSARLFTMVLLVPLALTLLKSKEVKPLGSLLPDKFLLGYLGLQFALLLQFDTFTSALRQGVFYQSLDWLIPYFVFSRGIQNFAQLKAIFQSFLWGLSMLAVLSCFESIRNWKLYLPMYDALGLSFDSPSLYLMRGDSLRSSVTTGHAITLGLLFAVSINMAMGFWKEKDGLKWKVPVIALLSFAGLWFTYSRGPLIGAIIGLAAFKLARLKASVVLPLILIVAVLVGLLFSPLGDEVRTKLPLFSNDSGDDTISYRQQLMTVGIQIVLQNPWFGVPASIFASGMESLRQGEGIIDLVNTYLGVALSSGLTGLSLFIGFYLFSLIRLLTLVQHTPEDDKFITRAIFGSIVAILVTLATASFSGPIQFSSVLLVASAVAIGEIVRPSRVLRPFRYTPLA
jgi:O-Antigen ligase